MKTTRRSLTASGICLLLCCALLVGATFAWFTDNVTNKGNEIKAGNLSISATVHELQNSAFGANELEVMAEWTGWSCEYLITGSDASFMQTGKGTYFALGFSSSAADFENGGPFIQNGNFEPGTSFVKAIRITNPGSLAAKVKLQLDITDNGLTNALWFAADWGPTTISRSPMTNVNGILSGYEVSIPAGQAEWIVFAYGMYEEAGNEYQGESFGANMTILATQDTKETDGFGSDQYDAAAAYPVLSADGLADALASGGPVSLGSNVSVPLSGPDQDVLASQMTVMTDTTLDLNGQTLGVVDPGASLVYTPCLISVNSGTLTLEGNGTVTAEAGANNSYGINVNGGNVVINDGYFYGAMTAVQVQKGSLVINGGFFDLAPTCKAQVPQYAKYIVNCLDAAYKDGTATIEIKGGTFVDFDPSASPEGAGTSYVAEGYTVTSAEQTNGEIWYTVVPE